MPIREYRQKLGLNRNGDLQTIQFVKDSLEQLKMSSFIQLIGNIQHVMILLLN